MTTESVEHTIEVAKLQIQERQLRLEESRHRLEKELHYLERWKVDVTPVEQVAIEAGKGSITFAQTAIKTGLILNGGALIALPAFVQIFSVPTAVLIGPISYFVIGLALNGIATICAFIAMSNSENLMGCIRELRVTKLNEEHNPSKDKEEVGQKIDRLTRKEKKYRLYGNGWKTISLTCVILGYTAFCMGAVSGTNVFSNLSSAAKQTTTQLPTIPKK